jgi:beta-galactosidase
MGKDGIATPWAWYRGKVAVKQAGKYVLQMEVGDRATLFVDDTPVAYIHHEGEVPLNLSAGTHGLAFFTAHDGRDKLAGFSGDMSDVDSKGLKGTVMLTKGGASRHVLEGWKFSKDGKEDWKDYTIGNDVFNKRQGTAWFRVILPAPPAGITKGQLDFRSVDENATVYLNGRRLARHEGWNIPFKVALDGLDTVARPLTLTIFIENYSNEGGIDQQVKVNYLTGLETVDGWFSRGVSMDAADMKGFVPFAGGSGDSIRHPCLYRAKFNAPAYDIHGDHIIWRVSTQSLGHGSVWVNGHNLGRYPEKVPAPGLYIPECWMKAGSNELVIFDEDGKSPAGVNIATEPAASRTIVHYIEKQ